MQDNHSSSSEQGKVRNIMGDFLLLTYVNKYVNTLKYRTNVRWLLQLYRIHSITSA